MSMGASYKIGWESPRFWEKENHIYGGISFLKNTVDLVWYPSAKLFSPKGVLIAGFNIERNVGGFGKAFGDNNGELTPFGALPSLEAKLEASRAAVETEELAAISEADVAPLRSFYTREMRPFLEEPDAKGNALSDSAKASSMFEGLRMLLPPQVHEMLEDLADICEEERQLNRQARLHHWLHGWLYVHVPLSMAFLVLTLVHAVISLRY